MTFFRIALAAALTIGSTGAALAAGGGGNGGATPPDNAVSDAVGSPNAEPPSYIVSPTTPTGSTASSDHWSGQGPETLNLNGQPIPAQTATANGPAYSAQ